MYSWNVILFGLVKLVWGSSETHYECGAHGKFEYCIDKEPGCIVGCHCHPGYYFDTDTKVCEPNLKLTQYRRHYDFGPHLEPTRVSLMNYDSVTFPTLTTTMNPVDEKVDAIAKDTDDLGDWLYNQFFKTIENQVINNTDVGQPKTRRSGGGPPAKPKRRSRKKMKKSKKSKKSKKGLKKKLLRITEDDSLFDSSSSSSSDESDSSSSESDSDSSDDHDHRKIVMINKKKTPPLPSFIFLPNVETPFYPPIGLPAPPIVPMYPMVPVPPMGMMYPGESTTETCETKAEASTDMTTTTTTQHTDTTTTTHSHVESTTTSTQDQSPSEEPLPAGLRAGGRKYDKFLQNVPNTHMGPRNKFLQKMREKMKKKHKRPPQQLQNIMDGIVDSEPPPFIRMPGDRSSEYHPRSRDDEPKLEDVDFKYLSQLIHKIDLNNTDTRIPIPGIPNFDNSFASLTRRSNFQHMPPIFPNILPNNPSLLAPNPSILPNNPSILPNNPSILTNSPSILPNNPNYMPNNDFRIPQTYLPTPQQRQRPISKADEVNDTYFTNLGKQIASLIRKHEPNNNREIDIEIQRQNVPSTVNSENFINENGFAQGRSYWERFVRSPLKSILPYIKSTYFRIQSGENLISIENMVNMATATRKPFSLQELENIISKMHQDHVNQGKVQHRTTARTPGVINQLKFNLLPQMNRRLNPPSAQTNSSDVLHLLHPEKNTDMSIRHYNNLARPLPPKVAPRTKKHEYSSEKSGHIRHNMTLTQKNRTQTIGDINNLNTLKNLLIMQSFKTPLHQQVSKIVQRNVTYSKPLKTNQFMKNNLNPLLMTYKNMNYLNNNHNINKYQVQRSYVPYNLPIFKPMSTKTSYFHHELHHFDFFDK